MITVHEVLLCHLHSLTLSHRFNGRFRDRSGLASCPLIFLTRDFDVNFCEPDALCDACQQKHIRRHLFSASTTTAEVEGMSLVLRRLSDASSPDFF